MTRMRSPSPHLATGVLLDHLDAKLDVARRRSVEEHLGRPCPACRERLRGLGELLETMRLDRTGEVPAWLHERAMAVFEPHRRPSDARRVLERLAELVFDSSTSPTLAFARRSVGEARRLRYRFGDALLDLEIEREGAATLALRGQLQAAEPALWTLSVHAGSERRSVRPEAGGGFALDHVPSGPLEMRLSGPGGGFRIPSVEP